MKTFDERTYRPLPQSVTIKPSNIDGLGLHAVVDLPSGQATFIGNDMNSSFIKDKII